METVLRRLTVIVLITERWLDQTMLTLLLQRRYHLVYRCGATSTVSQLGAVTSGCVMLCCKWNLQRRDLFAAQSLEDSSSSVSRSVLHVV